MGTPPAPPYATIYYGIHENMFVPWYRECLLFYKQFIDDIIGIWIPHPDSNQNTLEWSDFQKMMNSFPGLTWEFSTLSKTVDFMDMTIKITSTSNLHITLFEKAINLHLYIPPHSAHPPGLLPGIVYSTLFRIFTLCSCKHNKVTWTKVFSSVYLPMATKETRLSPSSTKPSPMLSNTLDHHHPKTMTTTR